MSEQEKKGMTPEEEDAKKNDSAANENEEPKDKASNPEKEDKDSKGDKKSFGQVVGGFFGTVWNGIKKALPFVGAFAGGALTMLLALVAIGGKDDEKKDVIDVEAKELTPIEDKSESEEKKETEA